MQKYQKVAKENTTTTNYFPIEYTNNTANVEIVWVGLDNTVG